MLLNGLINILFPVNCSSCNSSLPINDRFGVCNKCIDLIELVDSPSCNYCGRPFSGQTDNCQECADMKSSIENIYIASYYNETMKKIIKDFKYRSKKYLKFLLAEMLVNLYNEKSLNSYDIAVPIPLSDKKFKERSYNQAGLMAEVFAKKTGIRFSPETLKRNDNSISQTKLGRSERFSNIRGAFKVSDDVAGRRIIIIDDVVTTGATVQEAAYMLKAMGASGLTVLAVAHGR